MELLCMFCPAFLSLAIYLKLFEKEKNYIKELSYYFINNLIINFICLGVVRFLFNQNKLNFTASFTIKYLLLASFLAIILPFCFKKLDTLFTKYSPVVNEMINKGIDKNGKFSIKKFYKKNRIFCERLIFILSGLLLFSIIDIIIRVVAIKISVFSSILSITPAIMTLLYFFIFLLLQYFLPKLWSKIISIIVYVLSIALFITHYFMLEIKAEAFSMNELTNASEGVKFLNFLLDKITIWFVLVVIIIIFLAVINYIFLKKVRKSKKLKFTWKKGLICLIIIILAHTGGVSLLPTTNDTWEIINKPRYYYDNFVNPKKSLATLGIYEYTVRDVYLSIVGNFTKFGNEDEIEKNVNKYSTDKEKNDYTGIFKDKNLIMIMMESIDYATVDSKSMPTLTRLTNEGWNFSKRYSALSSGGSTINTEYVSQSGLLYDLNYYNNIFRNNYDYSLPNMFNSKDYKTSSIHENYGTYYNRQKLHSLLGFDESYFLKDITEDLKEFDDEQLAAKDEFYRMIVPKNEDKFMSLIVTISGHGPYDSSNDSCAKAKRTKNDLDCLNYLANRTDKMIETLIKKLDKEGILEDTVLILYTDHQAYSLNYPEEYLNSLPTIDSNHNIKAIPFVIYNKGTTDSKSFDNILVNDIDMVPTILNLFDIDYDPDNYIGVDLFSKDHKNLILFSDYTWYDGNIYSGNKDVDNTTEDYKANSEYTADKINLNSMILSNNYYKSVSKREIKRD